MVELVLEEAKEKMEKSIDAFSNELVNIRTGRVENVKVVQLSTEFSVALCKAIDKQRSTKFSNTMYNINIDRLYDMYTADQLAEMGTARCKIG